MMRYMAFSWPGDSSDATSTAQLLCEHLEQDDEWSCVFRSHLGITVFATGIRPRDDVRLLADASGVVLGRLFERPDCDVDEKTPCPAELGARDSERAIATCGRHLVHKYWGAYVAVVQDLRTSQAWILRSPLNAPPCCHVHHQGVDIYFSSIEDCLRIGLVRFSINWQYVAARLVASLPVFGATGLNEVTELALSQCVKIKGTPRTVDIYWNPCDIARFGVLEDEKHAIQALRTMTRACVRAWAAGHERIFLRLSGGLDSSIVLACLASASHRPSITCFHTYWPGPYADERRFARSAARRAGCELLEVAASTTMSLEGALDAALSVSPSNYALAEYVNTESHWARRCGASAIFCGTMGDALFHYAPAMPAVAEYLRRHGLSATFFQVLLDVAHLERASIWKVFRSAIKETAMPSRSWWLPYSQQHIKQKHGLLAPDEFLRDHDFDLRQFVHPWLRDVRGVPPGKLWQIRLLPHDEHWRNPYERDDDPISIPPLLSEPFAEVCLRIPTYLNVRNGWDRAIARRAFSSDLPQEVRERTSKGTPDEWVRQVVARNTPFLRDLLLDGALVKQGLLDARKLEAALPGAASNSSCPVGYVLQHMCTEIWLRKWMAVTARPAPA